jgi:hypothetical protein
MNWGEKVYAVWLGDAPSTIRESVVPFLVALGQLAVQKAIWITVRHRWSEVRAVAAIFIATLFGKARTKRPQTTD